VALLVALVAGAAGPTGARAAQCTPLQRLVGLADSGFARLKGFFDPRFEAWVATYRMPGTSVCTIQDAEDLAVYTCTWEFEAQSPGIDQTYHRLQQQVSTCLAVEQTQRVAPDALGETTRFGLASGRESVLVGKRQSRGDGGSVTLEILPLGLHELPAP
jgi:hypothetical protein